MLNNWFAGQEMFPEYSVHNTQSRFRISQKLPVVPETGFPEEF
jgi:hypothetical protein